MFVPEPDPKDHVAENVRRMRRIQRENKKKQAESPQPVPVKALWKSSKYDDVPSKVQQELKKEVVKNDKSLTKIMGKLPPYRQ